MQAQLGRTYAQIVNGKCHWIFNQGLLPEWKDDAFLVVDITGANPMPQVGWIHQSGATFPAPPGPTAPELAEAARLQSIRDDALRLQLKAQLDTATNAQ